MRAAGFTLLEVVVVITLLALVAAVTVPALRNLEPDDAGDRAVREVVRLLRSARSTALDRGSETTLILDPARATWWVDRDSGGTRTRVADGALDLPQDVSLASDHPRLAIRFYPSGRAESDCLYVRTAAGSVRIRLDPWTGEPDVR